MASYDEVTIIFDKPHGGQQIERVDQNTARQIFASGAHTNEAFQQRFGGFTGDLQFRDSNGYWKTIAPTPEPLGDFLKLAKETTKFCFRVSDPRQQQQSLNSLANDLRPAIPGFVNQAFAAQNAPAPSAPTANGAGWGAQAAPPTASSGWDAPAAPSSGWNAHATPGDTQATPAASSGGGGWGAPASGGGWGSGGGSSEAAPTASGWGSGGASPEAAPTAGGWGSGGAISGFSSSAPADDFGAAPAQGSFYGHDDRGDRGFGGGDRGGYRPRDDNGGGFRQRRDDNGEGGGYRGRRDDHDEGGYRGRRDDNAEGGYRGRRDDHDEGGYRGRRDDSGEGGGFNRESREPRPEDPERSNMFGAPPRAVDPDAPVRSRPSDAEVVMSRADAPRSAEFTEEKDAVLEAALFEGNVNTGINFSKYSDIPVTMKGKDAPPPMNAFTECGLHAHIIYNVQLSKYTSPTPVQRYALPALVAGRDLMSCAQTGSGKTAAFLLPMISGLMKSGDTRTGPPGHTPRPLALVMAPTRELASQIFDEARKFTYRTGIRPCVAYGGALSGAQLMDLKKGCEILIATPGRLYDFADRSAIDLSELKYLVFDEADRMLDMGFSAQINKIMDDCGVPSAQVRQTSMFSATFPPEIRQLARKYLKDDALFLEVGRAGSACENIEQIVMDVPGRQKKTELVKLLTETGRSRVLVFTNTKAQADFLDDFLFERGFPATSIHGDRNQQQRESALASFKRGKTPILVATDVAARGLDIPDVKLVVIYDMAKNIDDYVHRIGRTARAGNIGKAVTFYDSSKDSQLASELVKILEESKQVVPDFMNSSGGGDGGYAW